MIELVYSPKWFYSGELAIELVSAFVLLLISWFSFKYYKIDKNKNNLYLTLSFVLIGLALLFKMLMNFTIHYEILHTQQIGRMTLTYESITSSDSLFFIGFLVYRLLTLFGLYILYSIYEKQPRSAIALGFYLITVLTYFSYSAYYIFHLTSLIILGMITHQYIVRYSLKKNAIIGPLAASFGIITMSQLFYMFNLVDQNFYVLGECIQLVGYGLLLWTFVRILRHGKETHKDRHHR